LQSPQSRERRRHKIGNVVEPSSRRHPSRSGSTSQAVAAAGRELSIAATFADAAENHVIRNGIDDDASIQPRTRTGTNNDFNLPTSDYKRMWILSASLRIGQRRQSIIDIHLDIYLDSSAVME